MDAEGLKEEGPVRCPLSSPVGRIEVEDASYEEVWECVGLDEAAGLKVGKELLEDGRADEVGSLVAHPAPDPPKPPDVADPNEPSRLVRPKLDVPWPDGRRRRERSSWAEWVEEDEEESVRWASPVLELELASKEEGRWWTSCTIISESCCMTDEGR